MTTLTTAKPIQNYTLDYLDQLESESIHIIREVAGQFENTALLFSGGKDSIVLAHLAQKAFWPAPMPFTLLHIDTGHNFPETITFRDDFVAKRKLSLLVELVQDNINSGKVKEETGKYASRNMLQTQTLLDAIDKHKFTALLGGARRDEEKARAKERIFSIRDEFGEWNPKQQRPELWNMYNGKIAPGENVRVFPISNWTELDIWRYIQREQLELPDVYFAHTRKCFIRDGFIYPSSEFVYRDSHEELVEMMVRMRTVGDMSCTAAVQSTATTLEQVVHEIEQADTTERGSRLDDKRSEAAMEDRKKGGYF
jgi:sulfate adenylyltransferase subunit 2